MTNPFQEHVDICQQCRDHPFSLCKQGRDTLMRCMREYYAALGGAASGNKTGMDAGLQDEDENDDFRCDFCREHGIKNCRHEGM